MIGIAAGDEVRILGERELVFAFFSSIAAHAEPGGWGTRFPTFMGAFYRGGVLDGDAAGDAGNESYDAITALGSKRARDMVWNYHDRSIAPPFSLEEAPRRTGLDYAFRTPDGGLLIEQILDAFTDCDELAVPIRLVPHA